MPCISIPVMKSFIPFIILSFCIPFSGEGQSTVSTQSNSTYIHCTRFYISKPMRDLPDFKPGMHIKKEAEDKMRKKTVRPKSSISHAPVDYTDPIRQASQGSATGIDVPLVNFEGTDDAAFDPPDPNGAVSANYYVQGINIMYTVFDKTGKIILPAKDLDSLWKGDPDDGDVVVLYDKFADRWFLSEFQISNIPNQLCVAVSKTNDPTGAYYVWEYAMGPTYPDYPKYSIWTDGYYLTFQGINLKSFSPNVPQQVGVLERNEMLKGNPNAGLILANLPTPPDFMGGRNSLFSAPKTLDCDASALPPYGSPNYLMFFENIASGGYSNSIVMYKLATDTTLHTLTVSRADSFQVPTFNAYFSDGNQSDISQPGYDTGVDALDGTFNFRVPYVRFTGYNSVVLSNTVNLGNKMAGIRWYELRQNNTTNVWSIYQEGTYAPNDGVSRWNGAICEDYDGDIALAYSVSNGTNVYPGIRYTGRLVGDVLNKMTFIEQTAITGTSTLSNVNHRWGDYSELDIDPADGITFWCTNEYGGSSNSGDQSTRIFSFILFGNKSGIDEVQNQAELKAYQNGNFLEVKATGLPTNENLIVNLFDISGRQLTTQSVEPVSNMFETKINASSLPTGVYFVRIGRLNFQKVIKAVIN